MIRQIANLTSLLQQGDLNTEDESMISIRFNETVTPLRTSDLAEVYAAAKAGDYGTPAAGSPVEILLGIGTHVLEETLALDTPFIHLIGRGEGSLISSSFNLAGLGAMLNQTADNVRIANLSAKATGEFCSCLTQGSSVTTLSEVSNCHMEGNGAAALQLKPSYGIENVYGRVVGCVLRGMSSIRHIKPAAVVSNCPYLGGTHDGLVVVMGTLCNSYIVGEGGVTVDDDAIAAVGDNDALGSPGTVINCVIEAKVRHAIYAFNEGRIVNCELRAGPKQQAIYDVQWGWGIGWLQPARAGDCYLVGGSIIVPDEMTGQRWVVYASQARTLKIAGRPYLDGDVHGDVTLTEVGTLGA